MDPGANQPIIQINNHSLRGPSQYDLSVIGIKGHVLLRISNDHRSMQESDTVSGCMEK